MGTLGASKINCLATKFSNFPVLSTYHSPPTVEVIGSRAMNYSSANFAIGLSSLLPIPFFTPPLK